MPFDPGQFAQDLGGALLNRFVATPPTSRPTSTRGAQQIELSDEEIAGLQAVRGSGMLQTFDTGCNCNACGTPKFLPRAEGTLPPDPCFPRESFRTVLNSAGCKQQIAVWAPARKKPRMNPLNPRAAARSVRRLTSFARTVKRTQKALRAAAR